MGKIFGRTLLALAGVVVGLIVLEVVLQLAALSVGARTERISSVWVTGALRVLSIGDSNTYGLWLERDESYPSQLEAHWNATVEAPKIEVQNLGFPGTNSSRLRRDLPSALETLSPDIVILMIGANDYWTTPVQYDEDYDGSDRKGFFESHSLVVKLTYMLLRAFDTRRLEVDFAAGKFSLPPEARMGGPPDPGAKLDFAKRAVVDESSPRAQGRTATARFGDETIELGFQPAKPGELFMVGRKLQRNVVALVAVIRDFGASPVLMTYASRFRVYATANAWLRGAAESTGAELIDNAFAFESLCPQYECPEYLFADHHPNSRGYHEMAKRIVQELRAGLSGAPVR